MSEFTPIGEIVVKVYRYSNDRKGSRTNVTCHAQFDYEPEKIDVHEKSLKGTEKSHRTGT